MNRSMMSVILGMVALPTTMGTAAADTIYAVDLTVPELTLGGDAMLTAVGTITVDQLGIITTADIVNFSFAISSPDGSVTVDSTTGTISNSAPNPYIIDATASTLTITGANPAELDFHSLAGGGAVDIYQVGNDTILVLSDNTALGGGYGATSTPGPESQPFLLGIASSVVPEPSAFLLAGVGIAMGLGYAEAGRRRSRTRPSGPRP